MNRLFEGPKAPPRPPAGASCALCDSSHGLEFCPFVRAYFCDRHFHDGLDMAREAARREAAPDGGSG